MALGYQDTPIIPTTRWHVHDGERPQPKVVDPGNISTTPPVQPPADAIVLFDGSSFDAWASVKTGGAVGWKMNGDGTGEVVKGTGDIQTKKHFGDIQLHVEWSAPTVIEGEGQGRGNSGVFLMGMYEVQVLDCWQNPTYPDGTTAAMYGQYPPMVNACCRPGEWHRYDIIWQCPHFHGDRCVTPARITVLHNGIVVHHARELQGPTQHRQIASYEKHAATGPVKLQDHNNPVRFRNIWVREL
ncbi:MAG: DUF1080 domain-containing protein [Spirochaetota bacterium]